MNDVTRRNVLRGCGISFQIAGAICLAGALLMLVVGFRRGEWPAVLSYAPSFATTLAFVLAMLGFGLLAVVLGQLVKKGNSAATKMLAVACWLAFAFSVFSLGVAGHGWDGVGFTGLLILDAHVAVGCVRQANQQPAGAHKERGR